MSSPCWYSSIAFRYPTCESKARLMGMWSVVRYERWPLPMKCLVMNRVSERQPGSSVQGHAHVAKPAAFILWEIKSISSGKKFEHTGGCCPVMCTGKRPESSERRVGLQ